MAGTFGGVSGHWRPNDWELYTTPPNMGARIITISPNLALSTQRAPRA